MPRSDDDADDDGDGTIDNGDSDVNTGDTDVDTDDTDADDHYAPVPMLSREQLATIANEILDELKPAGVRRLLRAKKLKDSGTNLKMAVRLTHYYFRELNASESPVEQRKEFLTPTRKCTGARRPPVTTFYSQHFNGVDLFDKLLSEVGVPCRNVNWKLAEYLHAVRIALINAWVVYNDTELGKEPLKEWYKATLERWLKE